MPKIIQNADISEQLAQLFGLKGRVSLNLDETVVPVTILGGAEDPNPYRAQTIVGGHRGQLALGAGVYGGESIRAGAGCVLSVYKISLVNLSANPCQYMIGRMTSTQTATPTENATNNVQAFNRQFYPGGVPRGQSLLRDLQHNATVGTRLMTRYLAAGSSDDIPWPFGLHLFGNDPNGLAEIVVWNETVNEPVHATWQALEYRLPG